MQARRRYLGESLGVELENTAYSLDSTTIDLCLSVFPWAPFRTTTAVVKLHTLLDLRGSIPSFIYISDGTLHDVNVFDVLIPEAGAIYVMDRGYLDFERLYALHQALAFFVTRAKSNLDAGASTRRRPTEQRESSATRPLRSTATTAVSITRRTCGASASRTPNPDLRIKPFLDTSENAVQSQIWIAVSVYVLVAIVKKRLTLDALLYTLLQILSLTLFEKMPLQQAFSSNDHISEPGHNSNPPNLFAF